MNYYIDLFVQWKKYWATAKGKIFSIATLILAILLLFTYGLPAIFFLLVILIIEYFLYSNPDPRVRFRRNLLLFLIGIFEAGTVSFVASSDMGLIGLVIGLVFGALAAVVVHTVLILGLIVGGINAIKYYRGSKRTTSPVELNNNQN